MRLIWPWQDRQRRFSWLKAGAFALVIFPAVRFAYQFATGDYGTLPIGFGNMTYWSGVWATAILLMALAVTPAMVILRWPALVDTRRMIGVTALVYTVVHVIFFFGLRSWNFETIGFETVTRLTLVAATLSTIGLIVLGATSLDAAIRSMGARGWQRLHNTNYVITALAVLHVLLARGTYTEQYSLAGMFVWLMLWRVMARCRYGTDVKALLLLAIGCAVFTALLEAYSVWLRRGYDLGSTLALNFNPDIFDITVPPTWQVLAFGLVFAGAAAGRHALRLKPAPLAARQAG